MNLSTVGAFKHIDSDRCVILDKQQLKLLQHTLLDILDDFVEVCNEHHLKYCLGGGSALGAVRHQGMIPWDDDIDINMPRRDYERFIQIFSEKYSHKYWIHTPSSTSNYGLLLARIRLKGTCVKTREDFFNDECGAFIDIFIVENIPDHLFLRALHGFGSMALGFILSCRKFYRDRQHLLPLAEKNKKLKRVFKVKIALGFLTSICSIDFWTRIADHWNSLYKNENSDYVSIPAGRRHYFGEICPRKSVCEYDLKNFNGRQVNCAANSDLYLSNLYGTNYMTPPKDHEKERHVVLSPFIL